MDFEKYMEEDSVEKKLKEEGELIIPIKLDMKSFENDLDRLIETIPNKKDLLFVLDGWKKYSKSIEKKIIRGITE